MSKKKIEDDFLNYLIPLIEREGYVLVKKQLTGTEHLVMLEKREGRVKYEWSLIFLRYGRVNVFYKVYFDETTLLLNTYDTDKILSSYMFLVDIRTYINPVNVDDFFQESGLYDTPHSDDLMNGVNLEKAANGIFTELFKKPVPKLIDRLGTLEKADKLLNEAPTVDLGKQEFEWLVYSPNKVFQLMSSLLVGKVVGRKNLSELAEMYLEYISDIEPGARSDVDAIRSIIPKLVV